MTRTTLDPWGTERPVLNLTHQEMTDLLEYTFSLPTGVTIGKRWRRHEGGESWCIGEYACQTPEDELLHPGETAIRWWLPCVDGGAPGSWRERR
ncbi:hypothetical protein [Deinococcus gobiensis]|uniref:Uncharacterized protein n=1 Tax=Deinococcus gobiensis (strain DSM 21396 / JCM 16679 / CGMCC 1.7299 / I-0) TaxID=745776 RepID=H8H3U5_DEIGI|nr:hypothetical protein [Deinococcus gobiensis]AFD28192.1 hypothetical protein DGo_PE0048 [Deinococcus gobiensis I-0]